MSGKQPGWKRLWRHSYALGVGWGIREARHGWKGSRRVGVARLLVPLDPWRYYEMGIVAEQPFSGRCLDVSSPKLLPSLLAAEGKGRWTAIDLFEDEIVAWRAVDPSLELEVQDATALRFEDDTFDYCICISVLEHVGVGADEVALGEMWRVIKPGGVLHLTTEVAAEPQDVYITDKRYGDASAEIAGKGFFFKHDYGVDEVERLVKRGRGTSTSFRSPCRRGPGSSAGSTRTCRGRTRPARSSASYVRRTSSLPPVRSSSPAPDEASSTCGS